MRAVVQRVSRAEVRVSEETVGKIGRGLLILLGVHEDDSKDSADYLVKKCLGLRVFEDADGRMNLSAKDISGEVLVVSQFTLYGDTRKGFRPSFIRAARPEKATELYEYFAGQCEAQLGTVETGTFGAMMDVDFVNDGPVTILIDSERTF